MLLAGGAVVALTFERAVETAVSLIRVVAAIDASAFSVGDLVVTVVLSVAFEAAAYSLDRLPFGGVRAVVAAGGPGEPY